MLGEGLPAPRPVPTLVCELAALRHQRNLHRAALHRQARHIASLCPLIHRLPRQALPSPVTQQQAVVVWHRANGMSQNPGELVAVHVLRLVTCIAYAKLWSLFMV